MVALGFESVWNVMALPSAARREKAKALNPFLSPELCYAFIATRNGRYCRMAKAKRNSSRGRKQDRARVAGGQDYEVRYTAKKTKKSAGAVKKAVKKVGTSRKRVERRLGR